MLLIVEFSVDDAVEPGFHGELILWSEFAIVVFNLLPWAEYASRSSALDCLSHHACGIEQVPLHLKMNHGSNHAVFV